jgi:hypothetical protein
MALAQLENRTQGEEMTEVRFVIPRWAVAPVLALLENAMRSGRRIHSLKVRLTPK